MVSIKQLVEIITNNIESTGFPIPIPSEIIYEWAIPLKLPRRKKRVLYTGALYQLVPYINSLVKYLESLEEKDTIASITLKTARVFTKISLFRKIVLRVREEEVERIYKILRSIAMLLIENNIDYGYLYEDDLYSGVLLYDMGLEDRFAKHAEKVNKVFKKLGVEEVITVDPHTTYTLRQLYPKYIDGFDINVVNYLEILSSIEELKIKHYGNSLKYVIHDPCYYTRFENIIEEPRKLLLRAGIQIVEPRRAKELTYCCGGPIESIFPSLAGAIAEARLEELREYSTQIITLCPICLANFSRVSQKLGVSIRDIASLLGGGDE